MNVYRTFCPLPTFRNVVIVSSILRVALILYSEWHDAHSKVKYTDIDYRVFSDAARFISEPGPKNVAQGPIGHWLNIGDPYTRLTYRYTPLLALLLTPNEWIHPSFGKYLFAACDIVAGILMYRMLVSVILPHAPRLGPEEDSSSPSADPPKPEIEKGAVNGAEDEARVRLATLLATLHLLNPMVFSISTRGSSESVLSLFVLLTLYAALRGNWDAAAILLGLSTHWKIYPLIYGVACLGVIGNETVGGETRGQGLKAYMRVIVNWRTVRFALLSAGTFFVLGLMMYLIWGYPFLHEAYLYHLHRRDHRHNFSPYFYLVYLTYTHPNPSLNAPSMPVWRSVVRSPLTSFAPQMILALGAGFLFGRRKEDLVFTWFVQTVVFVVFNKVCTSQYFLWYLLFLPLLIPRLSISLRWTCAYIATWVGAQALWLSAAYRLEFLGENVFFGLWVRSLVYVVSNCWILAGIMDGYAR